MSDTTYNVFQHYGTAAERATFTPNPAPSIKPIYIWYETDTDNYYIYTTAWKGPYLFGGVTPPPSPGSTQSTFLVSGGQVTWDSSYTFRVSAADYYINGAHYTSLEQTTSLGAADATNDRIDVIALNTSGTVAVVAGTPASTPSEPSVDPAQYLKLGIVLVKAATTSPPTISNVTVYAENVGSPTEWNWTSSGASIVVNSTNNPRGGTICIEGTTVVAGVYAQGTIGTGTLNPNSYDHVRIFIRSKATWNSNRGLLVSLRSSGTLVGAAVQIRRSGTFGFDSSITSSYQQVAIPITAFAVTEGLTITNVRIEDFGGSIGFYIDDVSFQANATTPVTGGITQDQADARYAPLVHATRHASVGADPVSVTGLAGFPGGTTTFLRADGTFATPAGAAFRRQVTVIIDGGGSAITTGLKTFVSLPLSGTWQKWRILSIDAATTSGSIVIDVWKDTYANYPPTVADTITASAKPTLTTASKAESSTLTGWTTAFSAGDILAFNVDSITTVTKVALTLEFE